MFETKNLLFNLADNIAKKVYRETLHFPYKYQSSVGDQLRRACLSVVLNIVEGGARKSIKEKRQYNNIAYSSLKETKYLIHFASEFSLLKAGFNDEIMKEINRYAAILYGLIYKGK